jgi:hypothetical protein
VRDAACQLSTRGGGGEGARCPKAGPDLIEPVGKVVAARGAGRLRVVGVWVQPCAVRARPVSATAPARGPRHTQVSRKKSTLERLSRTAACCFFSEGRGRALTRAVQRMADRVVLGQVLVVAAPCAARERRPPGGQQGSVWGRLTSSRSPPCTCAPRVGRAPSARACTRPPACASARAAPRTKWTRRVPHPVLIGHAACLVPR